MAKPTIIRRRREPVAKEVYREKSSLLLEFDENFGNPFVNDTGLSQPTEIGSGQLIKCPVCNQPIVDPMPTFCPVCSWEYINDLSLNIYFSEISETDLDNYRKRITLARLNWNQLQSLKSDFYYIINEYSGPYLSLGHSGSIGSVAFSLDGLQVLSGSSDNTVRLWNIRAGKQIRCFNEHSDSVTSVAFSPDGRQVLSGSDDKTVRLWDIGTGENIRCFEGHSDSVTSVAFSPDGRQVLSASLDRTFRIWDIRTGEEVGCVEAHYIVAAYYSNPWFDDGFDSFDEDFDSIAAVAFSQDGRQALSGSWDETAWLWDIREGEKILRFQGHSGPVMSVAFSPDGQQVLSGSFDKTVRLWDIEGEEIRSFEGHSGVVKSVAFSQDGRQVLSGSEDKSVRLWDIGTGVEIRSFEGHADSVKSVAFSQDGRQVLSGSGDGIIILWDCRSGNKIIEMVSFNTDDWIVMTPEGFYNASTNGEEILRARTGNCIQPIDDKFRSKFNRPDIVRKKLSDWKIASR